MKDERFGNPRPSGRGAVNDLDYRKLWGKADYASSEPDVRRSMTTTKQREQEEIRRQIAEFEAKGGEITVYPSGNTALISPSGSYQSSFVLSGKEDTRPNYEAILRSQRRGVKASRLAAQADKERRLNQTENRERIKHASWAKVGSARSGS